MLSKQNLDAALVTSPPNVTYLSQFSNFTPGERETFLFITHNEQFIFTNALYFEEIKKQKSGFTIVEVTRERPFKKIVLEDIAKKHQIRSVGFENYDLTVLEYEKFKGIFAKFDALDLRNIRLKKNDDEIAFIEKACQIGDSAFSNVLSKIKAGMTEKQIALALESHIKEKADTSFPTIVAFGPHSSIPHHQTGDTPLRKGQIVLMDFGVRYNNYCSDMTRTIFFGKATPKQKRLYQTTLDAQKKAIEFLTSLILNRKSKTKMLKAADVDRVARDYIVSQGFPTIPHSLGHGIGIEVHESPRLSPLSNDVLESSMVFSIEPGIYIPEEGGVRIEDLVVLEPSGPRLLTHAPKDIIELPY